MNSTKTAMKAPLTGAQAVAQVIARQENPVVYGMPGGYTMHIYDALFSLTDKVETHLVREESIGTVMAEAHGRLTGQTAFVMGQGAWLLGNASIGIMEAHLGSSPMVILIDATDGGSYSHLGPYQGGFGGYGNYDLAAAMSAITKRTFVAMDPTQALQMTQLAIKHASAGEPGPVAVIFHGKSLFERLNSEIQPQTFLDKSYTSPRPMLANPADIAEAAKMISAARNPVIVSGSGVRLSKAEAALLKFAEQTGIPVATSPAGKGTFPEDHELAVGLMGAFGHETANQVVGAADLILAVGTKLGATDTANQHPSLIDASRQKIIQIDIEPLNISWTFPADLGILGDATNSLTDLLQALKDYRVDGRATVSASRAANSYFDRKVDASKASLSGRDAVAIMSKVLSSDVVVTCDAGENRLFVLREFQAKRGGTVLQPNGGGGMGYAVPAAMSAALNAGGRPAVAVCGDGGYSMSLTALMTAVELGLTLTVVVLNNGILGWVYNGQRGRAIASELQQFEYAKIAESIGCSSETVQTANEFEAALKASQERTGVSVIIANISKDEKYQDIMASLNKYDSYAVPESE